jgi:2-iminobutanoate/2-iminopropanoate deaminase
MATRHSSPKGERGGELEPVAARNVRGRVHRRIRCMENRCAPASAFERVTPAFANQPRPTGHYNAGFVEANQRTRVVCLDFARWALDAERAVGAPCSVGIGDASGVRGVAPSGDRRCACAAGVIPFGARGKTMEKQNYDAGLPATNAPFNLCVRHGDLIFISGLPPFDEEFSRAVREAREQGHAIPPFPNPPFAEQVRLVMDNMKKLVEAAGSNMDCLLKVIVWLKDQRQAEEFDRIYRTYFTSRETLPARTRMQAGRTPMDCGLEVEAIGYVPRRSTRKTAPARKRRAGRSSRKR